MKVLKILLLFFILGSKTWGQSDTLLITSSVSTSFYGLGMVTAANPKTKIEEIRKLDNWKPLNKDYQAPLYQAVWVRMFLKNTLNDSQSIFVRNPDNEICEYYLFENNQLVAKKINGEMISTWGQNETQMVGVDSFSLKSNATVALYIKSESREGLLKFSKLFPPKNLRFYYFIKTTDKYHEWLSDYLDHNLKELQVRTFYQGGLGVILVIIFFVYLKNRNEKLYLYYLLYVLAAFLFTLIKSRSFTYIGKIVGFSPFLKIYGGEAVMWLGVASYLIFVAALLDLKKNYASLYLFVVGVSKAFLIYGVGIFVWLILSNDSGLQAKLFIYTRIPLVLIYIGILVYTAKNIKSPMVKYVILSNALLIVFGMLAWLKAGLLNHPVWYGILNHLFTLPFAILLEIIIFALAIAQKISEDRKSKNELEKKAIEVEMMALRSQMNPHFIFNSLNTVRYFVISDQKQKAKNYLAKFSKLLRTILSYSAENSISLKEELDAIRLYLDVEADRFESNFFHSIHIAPKIDLEAVTIPPLLLQPFVENAILHGLRNSQKEEKILKISLNYLNERTLQISIFDNGIGRNKAAEMHKQLPHKSMGTSITNQRIELFNQNFQLKITHEIIDLPDNEGTEVKISLDVKNYK